MPKHRKPHFGARPGTLAIPEGAPPPRIHLIRYDLETVEESEVAGVADLRHVLAPEPGKVSWIDVRGLGSEEVLLALGELFTIHPLALEDVVNVPVRPKAEAYDEALLLITRLLTCDQRGTVHEEQVSLFLGATYVLTFQERPGDVWEPVRERIRVGKGHLRRSGADYLAYALLDAVVDAYYPAVETLLEELEDLEDEMIERPSPDHLRQLNRIKRSLLVLRRSVSPQREAVNELIRDENPLVGTKVRLFLRDVYDHCVHANESIDTAREMVAGLMNLYLSVVSNRTNDVMKVLTIVASIFVPLTFFAGIYGMNFEHMPELGWPWGYPVLLAAMTVTAAGMIVYFVRKGWIGGEGDDDGGD